MKFTPIILILLLITATITSCNEDSSNKEELSTHIETDTIVLMERVSNKPVLLSINSKKTQKTTSLPAIINISEYLGRGYDIEKGYIGSPDGVKFPVLDINKYIADHPDSYLSKQLGSSLSTSISFSSFDRYEEKSKKTKKISTGFKLNFKIFSLGAKHKYESSFTSETVNEEKSIFGELDIYIKDASYELLISSNSLKRMKKYLSNSFLDELYNTSNKELLENYGGFVLTDFISGGRATALFTGNYTKNTSNDVKEISMDKSIESSFNFTDNKDKASSIDFGIGNTNGSAIAQQNDIFNFKAAVKTYGGSFGYGVFTLPKSIDDININLSGWANSLNDRGKTVLIDINEGGLMPISNFIRESNFSHNINNYLSGDISLKDLEKPRIEAKWIRIHNQFGQAIVVLKTRFGDELIISDNNPKTIMYNRFDEMLDFAKQEAAKKLPYYKLEVVAFKNTDSDAYYGIRNSYKYNISDIQEQNMSKFIDSETNILYLTSNVNGNKFAYSIHDDYILDTYGIRDWVNSIPLSQMSINDLDEYVIVGL